MFRVGGVYLDLGINIKLSKTLTWRYVVRVMLHGSPIYLKEYIYWSVFKEHVFFVKAAWLVPQVTKIIQAFFTSINNGCRLIVVHLIWTILCGLRQDKGPLYKCDTFIQYAKGDISFQMSILLTPVEQTVVLFGVWRTHAPPYWADFSDVSGHSGEAHR